MKHILVYGVGGFIGGHLVKRLKAEGNWVRGADLKRNEFGESVADGFIDGDLRDQKVFAEVVDGIEKASVAPCRTVAEVRDGEEIEFWGDAEQTRSFLCIDECLEGVRRLMDSDFHGPVNIGSEEMVGNNQLSDQIADIAQKRVRIKHIFGPLGVRGRNSDNNLIRQQFGRAPSRPLREGLKNTYS